jgi:hypothetical protein
VAVGAEDPALLRDFLDRGIPRYLAAGERAPTGMTAMDFPKSSIYDRINNNNA